MLHAASVRSVVALASAEAGVEVGRKIEAGGPEEVGEGVVVGELSALGVGFGGGGGGVGGVGNVGGGGGGGSGGGEGGGSGFARPKRPGRR